LASLLLMKSLVCLRLTVVDHQFVAIALLQSRKSHPLARVKKGLGFGNVISLQWRRALSNVGSVLIVIKDWCRTLLACARMQVLGYLRIRSIVWQWVRKANPSWPR